MKNGMYLMLVICLLFVLSCVSTSVTKMSTNNYPATDPESITVYLDEKDIPGEYEKIALLHTKGNYQWTNESGMMKDAKKKAAKLGANGILLKEIKEPGGTSKVLNSLFHTSADRKSEVIAIRVKQ